jgi:hypothetical protein
MEPSSATTAENLICHSHSHSQPALPFFAPFAGILHAHLPSATSLIVCKNDDG